MSAASAAAATADVRRRQQPRAHPIVLVAGNPNAGKSTLFNALTGATTKVSNYPGVTVARTSATHAGPRRSAQSSSSICPAPTASARARATSRSRSTRSSAAAPRRPTPSSSSPMRRRSRATSTSPTRSSRPGIPVVVALSMIDEARGAGVRCRVARLSAALGAEVVPVVAPTREGPGRAGCSRRRAPSSGGGAPRAAARLAAETEADIAELAAAVGGRGSPGAPGCGTTRLGHLAAAVARRRRARRSERHRSRRARARCPHPGASAAGRARSRPGDHRRPLRATWTRRSRRPSRSRRPAGLTWTERIDAC